MNKISIFPPISDELINKVNSLASYENVEIDISNTRYLSSSDISKFRPNVTFSVTGGLDPRKQKFNNEYYQERTRYSSVELAMIVSRFERIERNINPLWNNLHKAMFVYKSIYEQFVYSECEYGGRDSARNLLGMITGKSVCAGFSMIYKEAMDRLGINCYYQNRQNHHAWNVLNIDGKFIPIELTWEVYNKNSRDCPFTYFGHQDSISFYSNQHHNLDYENEEFKFNLVPVPRSIISDVKSDISKKRIVTSNIDDVENNFNLDNHQIIFINGRPYVKDDNEGKFTFIRDDLSSFAVIPTGKICNGVREYNYIEYSKEKGCVRGTKIFSEMDLNASDIDLHSRISNNLLGTERVRNKINNFNGYVGYLTTGDNYRRYTPQFERDSCYVVR